METCVVCGEVQDSKHFLEYNICTTCSDLLEDLMSEYFLRTIRQKGGDTHKNYLKYLEKSSNYISDYKKIQQGTKRQIQQVGDRLRSKLEEKKPNQRYLEMMLKTLDWLKSTPEFYNYYFKQYYVCPTCEASIFENFDNEQVGDWLIISCEKCGTVIKKYYSPKLV
jgi:DNA-directed RNA polymerase subunit RPC12/RpoP